MLEITQSPKILVSIIICTCNRVNDLRQTLAALAQICVPEAMPTELVIVDNASTDGTAQLAKSYCLPNMPVRYVFEERRGKGYAYNRGIAEARSDVFLFTDDDVRPPANWIAGMCTPIVSGVADAVAGGVRFAPHLYRDWMQVEHRRSLASTERLDPQSPEEMVGANMAFSRKVLEKVPKFDTELGPGALGFGEDSLFSFQLKEAGYRVGGALDVAVEHHFDPARLQRSSLIHATKKHARTQAYLSYHWRHDGTVQPFPYLLKHSLRLLYWRIKRFREIKAAEGIPAWEMSLLTIIHIEKQLRKEQRRPRCYEIRGLQKRVKPENEPASPTKSYAEN